MSGLLAPVALIIPSVSLFRVRSPNAPMLPAPDMVLLTLKRVVAGVPACAMTPGASATTKYGSCCVPNARKIPAFAMAALLLSSLSLGECGTAIAGSSLLDARAQAAPPKTSIYDPPPQREKPAMTLDERLKLQKDLTAARDRHAPDAKVAQRRPLNPQSHR
jgi:hypothetical protein